MEFNLKRYLHNPILTKNPHHFWEAGSVLNPCVLYSKGLFRMYYRATNDIQQTIEGGYVSSIGYAESNDGIHFIRSNAPILIADQLYEKGLGCEDPRVTYIDGIYVMFYTAVEHIGNNKKVRIAIATSQDGVKFKKHGIVNNVTFPEGALVVGNKLYVYYGSGDQGCCLAECNFNELEEHLNSLVEINKS